MTKQRTIRVSASRLKTLTECTLKFYYQEVQWLPQTTHWKTEVGTAVHTLFECMMHQGRPWRVTLFRELMTTGTYVGMRHHPTLRRLVTRLLRRAKIADKVTLDDIFDLAEVAWLGIRPHFVTTDPSTGQVTYTPPSRFVNEHRFKITLSSGAVISGVIDLLLVWPDRALVVDLKSQAAKFTRAELPSNVQAALYQMVTYREEGFIPAVEFIMLRHAPSKRYPQLHIQRVEAPSPIILGGLEGYINSIYSRVNAFTMEEACSGACTDQNYCQFRCSYLRPFTYWVVCAGDDPKGELPLSTHLDLDSAKQARDTRGNGATVLERRHAGCAFQWNPHQSTSS